MSFQIACHYALFITYTKSTSSKHIKLGDKMTTMKPSNSKQCSSCDANNDGLRCAPCAACAACVLFLPMTAITVATAGINNSSSQ